MKPESGVYIRTFLFVVSIYVLSGRDQSAENGLWSVSYRGTADA